MTTTVTLAFKSRKTQVQVDSLNDLKQQVQSAFKIKPIQQRLLKDGKPIDSIDDVENNGLITVKDLGPQISWKLVFLLEYLGPIIIHLIFYLQSPKTNLQTISLLLVAAHYLKREFETLFVHRFSNGTMPILNLPKNCFHYWVLGGLFISIEVYSKNYSDSSYPGVALWIWMFAQVSNFATHLTLMRLRPVGTKVRKIPRGYGFDLVSCPNYFFEILGWISYSVMIGGYASWFFTIVGAVQMYFWAVKKHLRYKKEFKDYPKRRMLIPFIL